MRMILGNSFFMRSLLDGFLHKLFAYMFVCENAVLTSDTGPVVGAGVVTIVTNTLIVPTVTVLYHRATVHCRTATVTDNVCKKPSHNQMYSCPYLYVYTVTVNIL